MLETAEQTLLGPRDPPPYNVLNERGRSRAIVVCDHAGCAIPAALGRLGLEDWAFERHITWDIGSAALGRHLAALLDAPAVFASYSRLVVDPNRRLDDPTAFLEHSDGVRIPGNLSLTAAQKALRARACYWPYHDGIRQQIRAAAARGSPPAIVSVHSCTPVFGGLARPWQIGVLWNLDDRIARPLIENLRRLPGLVVGENEPYSGRHPHSFTLNYHAEPDGLPHVGLEVRQDLIRTEQGARHWSAVLAEALAPVLAGLELAQRRGQA